MQNASAPPANVVILEVPPGQFQDTENNDEVLENNDNEVPQENNETPRTEIFSSYEDQGRIPPPFPADNHQIEDVGTE